MHKKKHISVLLKEAVENLVQNRQGIYVDGTLGLGGHSEEILSRLSEEGKVIGLDWDLINLNFAKERLKKYGDQFEAYNINFSDSLDLLKTCKIGAVDGVLLDLGLSSPHVDESDRGFSFLHTGPLDMRFDLSRPITAADIVNKSDRQALTDIFRTLGEEKKAWHIAGEIVENRELKPYETTDDLKESIYKIYKREKIKGKSVATQVFQALRMAVNDELIELKKILENMPNLLKKGGRLVCISYHSLEDRMVKHMMREYCQDKYTDELRPQIQELASFKMINKKPILPSESEIEQNPRSRSAKMRVYERL